MVVRHKNLVISAESGLRTELLLSGMAFNNNNLLLGGFHHITVVYRKVLTKIYKVLNEIIYNKMKDT